ncbi:unnamed protein product [Pylaiella littoralis]
MPEALNLDVTPSAEWVLERMRKTTWKSKPSAQDAELFQVVPGYYACMTVEESGKSFTEKHKWAAAVVNYKAFSAGAFLRWLAETADFTNTPVWLDLDIMGRNAMADKILVKARAQGVEGSFYQEASGTLWRTRFMDVASKFRSQWNAIWDKLHNEDGTKRSGEQEEDAMEKFHEAIWVLTQEEKRVQREEAAAATKKKTIKDAAKAAGIAARAAALVAGNAEAESKAAGALAQAAFTMAAAAEEASSLAEAAASKAALEAAAGAGDSAASLAVAAAANAKKAAEDPGPMPPTWVHKYSLLSAILGRPAGKAKEHHQVSLEASSGPTAAFAGGGDGDGSSLMSPSSIKAMKNKGETGAGIPVSRGAKRKQEEDERRKVKREKEREAKAAIDERVIDWLTNPPEDVVFVDLVEDLKANSLRTALREERRVRVSDLELRFKLLSNADGMKEEADKVFKELLALLESPFPAPPAPAPAPRRAPKTATKSGTSGARADQGGDSIDLTAPDENGSSDLKGERSGSGGSAAGGLRANGEDEEEEEEEEEEKSPFCDPATPEEQPEVEGDAWGSAHTAGGAAGSALVLGINSTLRSPAVSRSGASGAIQRGVEIGPEKTTAPLIPASASTSAVAAPSSSVG